MVAVGMMAMAGYSKSPVKETAKVDAIKLANLDTTVAPGTDFYEYACGGWIKNNPLKPEYSRFGTFDQLNEDNQEQLRRKPEVSPRKSACCMQWGSTVSS
ncbi:hypothetical protein [Parabacteroides leei]|uniref:hypothetical protein n=2 Tax=Parabacteroides leei TaxID=2939491 RepID=UPI003D31319D